MKPAATLGLYAGALALVFATAFAVGDAVGPVGTAGTSPPTHSTDTHGSDTPSSLRSTVTGPDGEPLTGATASSEEDLHQAHGVVRTAGLTVTAVRPDDSSGHEPQS